MTARIARAVGEALVLGLGVLLFLDGLASLLRGVAPASFVWLSALSFSSVAALSAGCLLVASRWPMGVRIGKPARALLALLSVFALYDAAVFWALAARGAFRPSVWVPVSLGVSLVLFRASRPPSGSPSPLKAFPSAAVGVVFLLLCHLVCFGSTDYTRSADCAVVFGAKVHPDGRPSTALVDRLNTAVRLFQSGRVHCILVSGATGREGVNEGVRMRELLLEAGVPDAAILVDMEGRNTRATLEAMRRAASERGIRSFLSVTHYFHQPRVKLLAERQGMRCFTVPAQMPRRLLLEAYYVLREVPAFLCYSLVD